MNDIKRRMLGVFSGCLLLGGGTVTVAAPNYTLTLVGQLHFANDIEGQNPTFDINDNGVIIGSGRDNANNQLGIMVGFIWDETAGLRRIDPAAILDHKPLAINNTGSVVGWSLTGGEWRTAVRWGKTTEGGWSSEVLGTLGGNLSQSLGISNTGIIVGASRQSDETLAAFRWNSESGLQVLATQGQLSQAYAVNDAEYIVGEAILNYSGIQAVLWRPNGAMVEMGSLGDRTSSAISINNYNVAVGGANTDLRFCNDWGGCTSYRHAFVWTETEGMLDLSEHDFFNNTWAADINDDGLIVGEAHTINFFTALLWENNISHDLNTLLTDTSGAVLLDEAHAINNSGQIVATEWVNSKQMTVYLLTPIAGSNEATADVSLATVSTVSSLPTALNTYQTILRVLNQGPDVATQLSIRNVMTEMDRLVVININGIDCSLVHRQTYDCQWDALAVNASVDINITIESSSTEVAQVFSSVSLKEFDPEDRNNKISANFIKIDSAADLNDDGVVDLTDFAMFRSQFGLVGAEIGADFDNDGRVNFADFTSFRLMFRGLPGSS